MYFTDESMAKNLGEVYLYGKYEVVEGSDGTSEEAHCWRIIAEDRVWYLRSESGADLKKWMAAVEASGELRPTGWMERLGGGMKNSGSWARRWVVLNGKYLLWYKTAQAAISKPNKVNGSALLTDSYVEEGEGKVNALHVLRLTTNEKTHYWKSEDRDGMRKWMSHIVKVAPEASSEGGLPVHGGELVKRGKHGYWNKRWAAVKGTHFYWYTDKLALQARGAIPLRGASVTEASGKVSRICSFVIKTKTSEEFAFSAENKAELETWVNSVAESIAAIRSMDGGNGVGGGKSGSSRRAGGGGGGSSRGSSRGSKRKGGSSRRSKK